MTWFVILEYFTLVKIPFIEITEYVFRSFSFGHMKFSHSLVSPKDKIDTNVSSYS